MHMPSETELVTLTANIRNDVDSLDTLVASFTWTTEEVAVLSSRTEQLSQLGQQLPDLLDAHVARLQAGHEETRNALSTVQEDLNEKIERIIVAGPLVANEISERVDELGQAVVDASEAVSTEFTELRDMTDALDAGIKGVFVAFKADLDDSSNSLTSLRDEFDDAFQQTLGALSTQLPAQVDNDYSETVSLAKTNLEDALQTALTEADRSANEVTGELLSVTRDEVEGAINDLKVTLNDADDVAKDRLKRTADELGKQLVSDVISEIERSIADSLVLTQINTATTSALSPILPQLMAAKIILDKVRSLMSIM